MTLSPTRLIYLAEGSEHSPSGVTRKVLQQAQVWRELGREVLVLFIDDLAPQFLVKFRNAIPFKLLRKLVTLSLVDTAGSIFLIRAMRFRPQMIYSRYLPYSLNFHIAFKIWPVVFEINSLDVEEAKVVPLKRFVNAIGRKLYFSLAAGFCAVTQELLSVGQPFRRPMKVLPNSVGPTENLVHRSPDSHLISQRLSVAFVCSKNQYWQGLDKVERLAHALPEVDFHFIGVVGVAPNIFNHGELSHAAAGEVLQQCDAAISSLSCYMKNMNEACPLKSRQYFAVGLPFIYAYHDPDLRGDEDFALKLPNTATNTHDHVEDIREFIQKCRVEGRALREEMMAFGQKQAGVHVRETERLQFFHETIARH